MGDSVLAREQEMGTERHKNSETETDTAPEMEETQAGKESHRAKLRDRGRDVRGEGRGGRQDRWGPPVGSSQCRRGMGSSPFFPRCPPKPCLSLRKMDPPPSLMTMLSAQTLINTLS